MRVFALAASVCFSVILLSAAPQADVGTLTGIVKDGSGAALPRLIEVAVTNRPGAMTPNAGFAAAVAQFGMLLRHNPYRGTASYTEVAALARAHRGQDPSGYRAEFVRLVELAEALTRHTRK